MGAKEINIILNSQFSQSPIFVMVKFKILAIKNGSCNIKVSYMKLGERIIDIQSTCCCNNYGLYNPLACSCFLKKFNINFENK